MTAVTAALNFYPQIRIYSYSGDALAWLDTVVHSYVETSVPPTDLIRGEIERIRKYQKKGDLAAEAAALEYLNRRDRSD